MDITCHIVCAGEVIWQGPLIAVPRLDEEVEIDIDDGRGARRYVIVNVIHTFGSPDAPKQIVLIRVNRMGDPARMDENIIPLRSAADEP